ncbi:unnamed protein product [Arabis nemorensis]|uniref:Uncharacterized protein n=1 Tax=Arabis nemorensis TaxID=586526 RepID=A0A565B0K0_9BRAS|nr:unnamed protein product [Arabis nemorensis]
MIEESQEIISKVPAGVSGTALAASLLRDGWSVNFSLSILVPFITVSTLLLAKIYEKYQEAVDALRHEQLGRQEAESILQRV